MIILPQARGVLHHGVVAPADPLYASVIWLDHCNALNGPATCISTPVFTSVNLETTTTKFGGGSYAIPAPYDSGNIQVGGPGVPFSCGAGDFAWEQWVYITSFVSLPRANHLVVWHVTAGTQSRVQQITVDDSGVLAYTIGTDHTDSAGTKIQSASSAVALNTWHFVQLLKINGVTKLALNGAQVGSSYTDANDYQGYALRVGNATYGFADGVRGYFDEFRFTRGATNTLGARTINLPTAPFPYP